MQAASDKKTLTVSYKCVDGAHVFSSTDGLVCGLYAASVNLREAFDDVPVQAKTLLKVNHSIDAEVVHETTFEEFQERLIAAINRALSARCRVGDRDRIQGVALPSSALALQIGREMAAA